MFAVVLLLRQRHGGFTAVGEETSGYKLSRDGREIVQAG